MSQITYKEPLIQGKTMKLLFITVIQQINHKDNNMTFLLIAIMPQIIHKEFFPFIFLAFFFLQLIPIQICLIYN